MKTITLSVDGGSRHAGRQAIYLSVRHQISYWDAAIIAAARSLGAPILYREDLNHGQSYADVQVLNPFRPS